MTCGLAVKRPHDYEAYLSTETGVEVKRSRTANPHCSPFRPQLGTLASSLPSSSTFAIESEKANNAESGPFGDLANKHKLSSQQLESYLLAEVQYLKRRKLIPRYRGGTSASGHVSTIDDANSMHTENDYRCSAGSPSSSHSGSESDGEPASPSHMTGSSSTAPLTGIKLYNKPQFSLKQVKLICERLLKEQEIRLRYEYETALNKKLEEQHDQYVQFAKEQIESQNFNNDNEFFYLS